MAKVAMPVGFQLASIDDGTLDTVVECQGCEEVMRFDSSVVRTRSGSVAWDVVYSLWFCKCVEALT